MIDNRLRRGLLSVGESAKGLSGGGASGAGRAGGDVGVCSIIRHSLRHEPVSPDRGTRKLALGWESDPWTARRATRQPSFTCS